MISLSRKDVAVGEAEPERNTEFLKDIRYSMKMRKDESEARRPKIIANGLVNMESSSNTRSPRLSLVQGRYREPPGARCWLAPLH